MGFATYWIPWFSYIFLILLISPKICSPDFTMMSDNLFDRDFVEKWQVLWTSSSVVGLSFRPHPIRQIPSLFHRDVTIEPPPLGTTPTIRKPLKLLDFGDVSVFFSWVYYKTKGYKKSLMHWILPMHKASKFCYFSVRCKLQSACHPDANWCCNGTALNYSYSIPAERYLTYTS